MFTTRNTIFRETTILPSDRIGSIIDQLSSLFSWHQVCLEVNVKDLMQRFATV